ncbi:hypothetical protein HaLaN_06208 [Haematococcus lacustris]|uniref:Uncharacterized protein n=1 Tax=Haematococcus lacustris TaxID=44745 RepID=A0A699Z5V0_HAELA|nr:hypothetical protein HaLaN_06208 [Haematococcus lacustris]
MFPCFSAPSVDHILSKALEEEILQKASSSEWLEKTLAPLFEQYALNAPVGPEKWTKLANFLAGTLSGAPFQAKRDLWEKLGKAQDCIQSLQQQLNQANATHLNTSTLHLGQVAQAQSRITELEVEANAARTNASTLQSALSEVQGKLAQAQSRVAELQEKVESLQVELDEQEARRLQPLLTSMHTSQPSAAPPSQLGGGAGTSGTTQARHAFVSRHPCKIVCQQYMRRAQTIEEPDTPPLRDPPELPYDVAKKLEEMTKEGLIGTLVDAGIVKQGATPGKMWLSVAHHLLPKDKAVPAGSSLADLRQRLLDANCITLAEDSRGRWEELVRKAWEKNKDGVNYAVRRQSWVHTNHTKEAIRAILLRMGYVHEVAALGPNPSKDMWRKLADKLLRPQMVA